MKLWTSVALAGALTAGMAAFGANLHAQTRARTLLAASDETSQIGVTVHDADTEDAARTEGVVVDEVQRDSPAEKAGVKSGDRIVEFDGERVRSARQFTRVVRESVPDRQVAMVVTRGGGRVTMDVRPVEGPSDFGLRLLAAPERWTVPAPPPAPIAPRAAPTPAPPPVPFSFEPRQSRPSFGISTEQLDDQLADYFAVKSGVLVRSVSSDSDAAKAGLKAGDVITAVNGDRVDTASDVARALARAQAGDAFTLDVVRDRKPQTLKGKIARRADRTRYRTTG
ncbi:MAG: PDZ domain-containing protein [Vicinamibacterales bacterium]